jgi:hypothetical protein
MINLIMRLPLNNKFKTEISKQQKYSHNLIHHNNTKAYLVIIIKFINNISKINKKFYKIMKVCIANNK